MERYRTKKTQLSTEVVQLQCVCSQSCPALGTPWTVDHRLLCPWIYPGKNTGVGSHFLYQRIFLIQGSNPHCLHCRRILYWLSHQGYLPFKWGTFQKVDFWWEFSTAICLFSHKRGLLYLERVVLSGYTGKETCIHRCSTEKRRKRTDFHCLLINWFYNPLLSACGQGFRES